MKSVASQPHSCCSASHHAAAWGLPDCGTARLWQLWWESCKCHTWGFLDIKWSYLSQYLPPMVPSRTYVWEDFQILQLEYGQQGLWSKLNHLQTATTLFLLRSSRENGERKVDTDHFVPKISHQNKEFIYPNKCIHLRKSLNNEETLW